MSHAHTSLRQTCVMPMKIKQHPTPASSWCGSRRRARWPRAPAQAAPTPARRQGRSLSHQRANTRTAGSRCGRSSRAGHPRPPSTSQPEARSRNRREFRAPSRWKYHALGTVGAAAGGRYAAEHLPRETCAAQSTVCRESPSARGLSCRAPSVWHAGVDRRGRRGAASGALCASAWGWAREAAADHARTEPALAPATVAASSSPRVATLTLPDTHLLFAERLHATERTIPPDAPGRRGRKGAQHHPQGDA